MSPNRTWSCWLLKTEPSSYSFEDLWRAPRRTVAWSGVRNHQAKIFLRDRMKTGDHVLIYHSSSEPPGVAGLARVCGEARPDPTQFQRSDPHFDPRSRPEDPTWWEIDIQAVARAPRFVPLATLRADPALEGMALLQRGQRLSVQPVDPAHFEHVLLLAGLRPSEFENDPKCL